MSDYELKRLAEDLKKAWDGELKPRIEGLAQKTAEGRQALDRVQDRMDEIEARMQKAALAPVRSGRRDSREGKAYETWLRHGITDSEEATFLHSVKDLSGLSPEAKALALRDQTTGGVLVPDDYVPEVIKGIVQYSPIRTIAKVRPTKRTSIKAPKRTGNLAAQWTAETGTRSETGGSLWGLEEIPTHELYARVIVSNWDLEDAAVDLAGEVQDAMSEQFGVAEGTAFVGGDGNGKPEGFLVHPNVEQVLNGATTFTNADGLVKVFFTLKEQYWTNATWALNRLALRDIRLLKDSQGQYLWQPAVPGGVGVAEGLPPTILDRPYVICPDMPVVASAALTVALGDWKRAYWIPDRLEVQTLRDPYTRSNTGEVVIHARKRVGGQVVVPEAIKLLKMT